MMSLLDIAKVKALLDEVNGMIETTLLLTRDDVGRIMLLLKKLDEKGKNGDKVRAVIQHLQSFDIFEQRLRHIVDVNNVVPLHQFDAADKILVPVSLNVFRLNQLQYEAAWSDYVDAISKLKTAVQARDVKPLIQFDFSSMGIITKAVTHVTFDKFERMIQLTSAWKSAHMDNFLALIEKIYTTERERKVLLLLQENPVVTINEINLGMMAGENNGSSIELF